MLIVIIEILFIKHECYQQRYRRGANEQKDTHLLQEYAGFPGNSIYGGIVWSNFCVRLPHFKKPHQLI